jgi:uncharacterized protein (TIGR03437 family)
MLKRFARGFLFSGAILFAPVHHAFAQSTIVGAGYTAPFPLSVAPGQVVTLFVHGLELNLPAPVAATTTPSLSLAGVSATIYVTILEGGLIPVPILSVRNLSTCPTEPLSGFSVSCGNLTAVTVQIPYNLPPLCPLCLIPAGSAWLYVTYNGQLGSVTELNGLADQVHILSACDLLLQGATPQLNRADNGLPCAPIVTHADGSLVSASKPAKPGEEIVAWATGLGGWSGSFTGIPSGTAVTAPVPTRAVFKMAFNYATNALPSKPGLTAPAVLYSGLVPGSVGLYQINFVTPPAPPGGATPCAQPGTFGPGDNAVQSNLTVSFGGGWSFDGAGICVLTQ